ncbi:MAG: hypothetical protein Kow0027_06410 [Saprospiraceae bacterium]
MKKILFPTDFSEGAKNALKYTIELAKQLDAKIDVTHIFNLPFIETPGMTASMLEKMIAEKKNLIQEKLHLFMDEIPKKHRGDAIPVYGVFIPEEIHDLAEEGKYDMVAMGTLGEHHTQFEKIVGSVTTNTLMRVKCCPVLAIPIDCKWNGIKRIAYATDFHPKDEVAASKLLDLAMTLGARVHFVHVESHPQIGEEEDTILLEKYPFDFTDFAVINSPDAISGFDRYLNEKKLDLLALFIPKRRLWERLFHSSFTKKMTFHTKIPLIVYHANNHA